MPPKKAKTQTIEPRQIGTRAKNKFAHPGQVTKSTVPRRTSAEVQQERDAKAQAKADREESKRRSINRAAEFEHTDMANEDLLNATPRPPFTPKPWPPRNTKLVPVAESNELDFDDNKSLSPAPSSETESDSQPSLTESDSDDPIPPGPPAKKQKIQATQKATGSGKAAGSERGRKVMKVDEKVASEEENWQTRTPMPKKVKAKVRDEIEFAAKKMENEVKGDNLKYRDMVSPYV
jgi:hypothetical protein